MRHFGRAEKTLPVTGKDGLAMTVEDVRAVLGARVLVGKEHLDREVRTACGSDMMSDVLAFSKDHGVLLTGLVNPQVVRTAEMLDIVCIISGGRKPTRSSWIWPGSGIWWCWRRGTGCLRPAACSMRPGCGEVRSDG